MKKEQFNVTGMTCSACSAHVEKAVSKLPGVKKASVSLLQNKLTAEFDERETDPAAIVRAVEKAGYGASEIFAGNAARDAAEPTADFSAQIRSVQTRFWTSVVFLLPLFYISMGHMSGLPLPGFMHGTANAGVFALTQFVLTLPVLYVNRSYFINGFKTLFRGAPNMDSLIAVGSSAAVVYGVFALFQIMYGLGHGDAPRAAAYAMDLYFESAVMILTLITLGKWLEARAKGKTSAAISALVRLTPDEALVRRGGKEETVPVFAVVPGDVIIVRSGARIAADGEIIKGSGAVDESALTGESVPLDKTVGDAVSAGTINLEGYFEFKASRVGSDTALSQIIRLVEEANSTKAPIAKLADQVSGVFVPAVIGIALVACVVWLLAGAGASFALSAGIAVLVISCPCALGLATPTAIMVGTGQGAKRGILIKSAESLETAGRVSVVVLDKTGTVTTGKPEVVRVLAADADGDALLSAAAGLEKLSQHPFARALEEAAAQKTLTVPAAENFELIAGRGVRARVNGRDTLGGNRLFMEERGITLSEGILEAAREAAQAGQTPLYFAADGKPLGVIMLADRIKPGSRQAVETLKNMGLEVLLLTGDNAVTARAVAGQAGIDTVIAGVLPQGKEAEVRRLQEAGRKVAMVGDGINDAPALARADVGIALGAGTDVSIESASVVLMKDDLREVPAALQLSRAVIRNIKQNLFWAFFYNVIGIPLAAGVFYPAFGWKLNPMFAAAAMSLSSVFVVGNALRLRYFKPVFTDKTTTKGEPLMKKTLVIEGMSCGHCAGHVERALNSIDGVRATVNLAAKTAEVESAAPVDDEQLKKAVQDAGYEVVAIR